jgi:hypothetical protein
MAGRDRRGARTGRKARPRRESTKRSPAAAAPTYAHPLYGPIPLLVREWVDGGGERRCSYEMDPDYQPPLPPGAVRGNPHRQRARGVFDTPRYFYVDYARVCVQCREEFVFGASEQKHWYETLGFNFASFAIRCPRCRRQRRTDKALHHAVDDAKREALARPEEAGVWLAVAEAIVELRARQGRGRPDEAIAAARTARRLLREQPAKAATLTHYWEGRAQALAGRDARAEAAFAAFLVHAGARAHRQEIRVAQAWAQDADGDSDE